MVPVEADFFATLSHDVLIIGASARAAAFSAMRCGMRPHCADHFADRDLAAVCPVERVDIGQRAEGFAAAAESLPPSPWFYTGGLENHPALVERISRRHHLWGVGADVLRQGPRSPGGRRGPGRGGDPGARGSRSIREGSRATGAGWSSPWPRGEGSASSR